MNEQWERTEFRVAGPCGTRGPVVQGGVCVGIQGLAVTPGLGSLAGRWMVTHVPSGDRLGRGCETKRAACALLIRLGALGDWTRSRAVIRADVSFVSAAAAICNEPLVLDE